MAYSKTGMSSLPSIFQRKLIPWAQDGFDQRLIVARPVMKKSAVPSDVELTRTKIPGKRAIIRNRRVYGNQRVYYADWPEAGLHELDVPKLVCVLNGVIDLHAGEYIITCNQGHFIFLPPRTPITFSAHSLQKGVEGSCTYFHINLYRDSIHCMLHSCRNEEIFRDQSANCLIRHSQTVQMFRMFVEELSSGQAADLGICGDLLSALFRSMSREIAAGHQLDSAFHAPEHPLVPKSVQEIRDHIRTHLQESLTIEKVARAMYMSPSQFTHYIRDKSGQSFVEMHTECRIAEAKFLLRETKWTSVAISQLLGFKSSTYFNEFFRQQTGIPPGAYRKKSQKEKIQRKS